MQSCRTTWPFRLVACLTFYARSHSFGGGFFFHLCLCVDVFLSSTFFVLIKYSLLFSHTCRPQQKRVREQSDCGCCAVVVVRSLVRLFMLALCSLLFSAARAQLIFVDSFFVCRFFVYTILFIRFLGFSFSCFSFLGFSSFFFVVFLGTDRLRLFIPNFPICIHYVERSISRVSGSVVTRLRLRFRLLFYIARHFRLFHITIVCSANNCLLVAPSRSKCAQQASGASFYFLHYMAALPLPLVTKNSCYHAVQLSNVSINNNNNKGRTGYFDQTKPKKKAKNWIYLWRQHPPDQKVVFKFALRIQFPFHKTWFCDLYATIYL